MYGSLVPFSSGVFLMKGSTFFQTVYNKDKGVLKGVSIMFKKILVSTDASEYSCHAFATAVDIAKTYNAKIIVLHVVDKPDNFSYMGALISGYALFSDDKISEIGQQVIKDTIKGVDTKGVKMISKVSKGYAAAEILKEMENGIDLIVMGSRGHGPLKGALTGSVTLNVLAQATCPVMVVK